MIDRQAPAKALLILVAVAMLFLAGSMVQAQEGGEVSPIPELATALNQVQGANSALKDAEEQGNKEAIDHARERFKVARRELEQNLARVAGVQPEDVAAMERAGLGWLQIAEELGLYPGLLGLEVQSDEPAYQTRPAEQARQMTRESREATSRDMQGIHSSKHGMSAVSSGSMGMGLGKAKGSTAPGSTPGFSGPGTGMGFSGPGSMGGLEGGKSPGGMGGPGESGGPGASDGPGDASGPGGSDGPGGPGGSDGPGGPSGSDGPGGPGGSDGPGGPGGGDGPGGGSGGPGGGEGGRR
jgi:hypothetical protein